MNYPEPRFEDHMVPRKRELLLGWLFSTSSDEWHGMAADLLARTHGQTAVQVTQLLDFLGAALKECAHEQ